MGHVPVCRSSHSSPMLRAIRSCALASLFLSTGPFFFQTARSTRVAVLDFGTGSTGSRAATEIRNAFSMKAPDESAAAKIEVIDRDEARTAALGCGYQGSVNLEL